MRYYKLMYNYEKDDEYIYCANAQIGNINRYSVDKGCKIENWEKIKFEFDSKDGGVVTDYVANLYTWFIISERFVELLKPLIQDDIQYLPIELVDKSDAIPKNIFYVANILTVLNALDLEESEYDVWELGERKLLSVVKYALKEERIGDKHIFRLKDDKVPIFVSEEIKRVIESNKLLGFDFLEVRVS